MSARDPRKTELGPNDRVQFLATERPRLKSGDYVITARQKIRDLELEKTARFAVAGARLSLPSKDIHAVFPPDATHGAYHRVLPHVLLDRVTLPWERSPRADGYDDLESPCWMALLLFSGDEVPEVQTVKAETLAKAPADGNSPLWRKLPHEVSQDPHEGVTVIDVPWKLLKTMVPTYRDLRVLAHARKIRYAEVVDVAKEEHRSPEVSVVMGNRLPPSGEHCVAHLVSLENRYTTEEHLQQTAGSSKRPAYKLPWADGLDTFEFPDDGSAADLKALLVRAAVELEKVHSSLEKRIQAAHLERLGVEKQLAAAGDKTPRETLQKELHAADAKKHGLEQLLERLSVELHLESNGAPRLLAPLLHEDAKSVDEEQITCLLSPAEMKQVQDGGVAAVECRVKGFGALSAELFTRYRRKPEGGLARHTAATVTFETDPGEPPQEAKTLLGWLQVVHKKEARTLVLRPGRKPLYYSDEETVKMQPEGEHGTSGTALVAPQHAEKAEGGTEIDSAPSLTSEQVIAYAAAFAPPAERRGLTEYQEEAEYAFTEDLPDASRTHVQVWAKQRLDYKPFGPIATFVCGLADAESKEEKHLEALEPLLEVAADERAVEMHLESDLPPMFFRPVELDRVESHLHTPEHHKPTTLVDLSLALLSPGWRARAKESNQVRVTRNLKLAVPAANGARDRDLEVTLDYVAGEHKRPPHESGKEDDDHEHLPHPDEPPRRVEAVFTLRPVRRLYFDHLGAEGSSEDRALRLVSLKSWSFNCDPAGPDFVDLLRRLDGVGAAAVLRRSAGEPDSKNSAQGTDAWNYLSAGYVPLQHRLRQGDRTVSWYRGPLIPALPASGDHALLPMPARSADQLLILDRELGMFDASYAAAWELGRTMSLADEHFSVALHRWKRAHKQDITFLRQRLDHDYLPVVQPSPAGLDLPAELTDWLSGLTRLEGVPFNYLVPEEELLPPESIRFFVVDPMWIEALRDGAMSIGRVLRGDHGYDIGHWERLDRPPRISGFLMRSSVVSGWPGVAVKAYAASHDQSAEGESVSAGDRPADESGPQFDWKHDSHLADRVRYHPLPFLRRVRLAPDLMLCMFLDDEGQHRGLNLLEFHLPPQILHFGLEEAEPEAGLARLVKTLRDPSSGDELGEVDLRDEELWLRRDEKWWGWVAGEAAAFLHEELGAELCKRLATIAREPERGTTEDELRGKIQEKISKALGDGYSDQVFDKIWSYTHSVTSRRGPAHRAVVRREILGGVLDVNSLFNVVADRLAPLLQRSASAGEFGLQMLDAAPMVRIYRSAREA